MAVQCTGSTGFDGSAVQYSAVHTVQCSTVQCSTVQCSVVQPQVKGWRAGARGVTGPEDQLPRQLLRAVPQYPTACAVPHYPTACAVLQYQLHCGYCSMAL